ncbi:hypothetical protein BRAS3843_520185 [Bradyrhizobium sp. STM 3843]|uniref:hypothetical protein n=1 Tax=Bradyrhizobium sp. STM 3843 TaxID=551947 RepID=UPI00024030F7|nr:hypothetical protein [Bradyrhizobium sp. STM 3843]CCE10669.1 hypothetical protein BRAS3843_520185 [Bradyrhizobium sp. STM 3843]
MSDEDANLAEIERQIAAATEDLRELIGQADAYTGTMGGDAVSQLIEDRVARLELLIRRREQLLAFQDIREN